MKNRSHYLFYALLIATVNLHAANHLLTELDQQLFTAIGSNASFEDIMNLFIRGASINARDHQNQTFLHIASERGNLPIVKELIFRSADVAAKDIYGRTPLHMASFKGHVDIARELIAYGADVNAVNRTDNTPLHRAAGEGHLETVKFLLECGADPKRKNAVTEATPIDIAERYGFFDLAKYISNYDDIPITKGAIMEDMSN